MSERTYEAERKAPDLSRPIAPPSAEVRAKFDGQVKLWKNIPLDEKPGRKPKELAVVPGNDRSSGEAVAYHAYYRRPSRSDIHVPGHLGHGLGEFMDKVYGDPLVPGSGTMEGTLESSPLVKLRPELVQKLNDAQMLLNESAETMHLKLVAVDGYRPLATQKAAFDEYCRYLETKAKSEGREITPAQLRIDAQKIWSIVPDDPSVLKVSPPPHSTGGSVDVILVDKRKCTLKDKNGAPLVYTDDLAQLRDAVIDTSDPLWARKGAANMGSDFDEMMHPVHGEARASSRYYEDELEREGALGDEETEALQNRRILVNAMQEVGFSNYHNEWWHYDLGNQFHAARTGGTAKYGFAGGLEHRPDGEYTIVESRQHEANAEARHLRRLRERMRGNVGRATEAFDLGQATRRSYRELVGNAMDTTD